jgi:transposase-like protein
MTKPIARDPIYRRRRFESEIIQLCVRWYITYRLSYRALVAMMAERGLAVSQTTTLRCRKVHSSWRVDETYIPVRGKWHYLYRAVDKRGKTVDFLLRPDRGIAAAQAFFRKALATSPPRRPRKITLDGHALKQCSDNAHWHRSRIGFTSDNSRSVRVVSGGPSHSSSFGTGRCFRPASRVASAPEPRKRNYGK